MNRKTRGWNWLTFNADMMTQRESSNINFFIIGTKYFLRKFRLHRIEINWMFWAHAFRLFHKVSSQSLTYNGSMCDSSTSTPSTSHITGKTVTHCLRTLETTLCVNSINFSKKISFVISVPIMGATFAIIYICVGGIKFISIYTGTYHYRKVYNLLLLLLPFHNVQLIKAGCDMSAYIYSISQPLCESEHWALSLSALFLIHKNYCVHIDIA